MPDESDDGIKRIEEVTAQIMRAARDEKIKLDTTIHALNKEVTHLRADIRDLSEKHSIEYAALARDRDYYLQHTTRLETELRSIVSILRDALSQPVAQLKEVPPLTDDGEPSPAWLHNRKAAE